MGASSFSRRPGMYRLGPPAGIRFGPTPIWDWAENLIKASLPFHSYFWMLSKPPVRADAVHGLEDFRRFDAPLLSPLDSQLQALLDG